MDDKTTAALREVFERWAWENGYALKLDVAETAEGLRHTQAAWAGFLACYQHLGPQLKDAERYRYLQGSVCATRVTPARCEFFLQLPAPIKDPMRGSVAQHFDEAIDAALDLQKEKQHAQG